MKLRKLTAFLVSWMLMLCLLTACAPETPEVPVIPQTEPSRNLQETETTYPEVILQPLPRQPENNRPLRSEAPGDASGFVLVSDYIPDAILEIRYYSTYNFVGDRIDGYEEPCALLTREAAEALKAVSDELVEKGYRIKIFDAYRPQMAVDHFLRWAEDTDDTRMKAYFYPDVEKSQLFSRGYIASRSGHSRGSTVDLTLFDMATGREVDMGGPFDFFGELSHGDYVNLTEEQKANRALLRDTMTRHGFRALATEWWHFTLQEEPYPEMYFTFPVCEDSVIPEEN